MYHLRNGSILLECNAVLLQDLECFVTLQLSTFAREPIIFSLLLGGLICINEYRNLLSVNTESATPYFRLVFWLRWEPVVLLPMIIMHLMIC